MTLLASLKHRPFLLLWIGQTVSRLGDRVYEITLVWWVLEQTHSATAMGGVLIASFLPTVAFVLIGGVFADRLPRIPIMLVSDGVRGALALCITALAYAGYLPFWPIMAVNLCFGVMDALFLPSYSAVIPQLVPDQLRSSANAVTTISARAMDIAGPAVGASLIAAGGTPLAFALNSGSFIVSALLLVGVLLLLKGQACDSLHAREGDTAPAIVSRGVRVLVARFAHDLREGIRTVRELTWVWLTIVLAGLANFVAEGATGVALPYLVQRTLKASPLLYGELTGASAVGAVLGAAWLGSRPLRHRGHNIYGYFVAGVLPLTVIGIVSAPLMMLVAMFVYGWCITALGLAWTNALQEYIPAEKLGRVSSIDQFGSFILIPMSYGVAGIVVDRLGAAPVLIWSGLVAAAIVSMGWFSRSVRTLE